MTALSLEDYVRNLFRCVLGRDADPDGLQAYVALLDDTKDPTCVLAALLDSPEYAARLAGPTPSDASIQACLSHLNDQPITIVDIGAQMLEFEEHIYRALCRPDVPHRIIGFEPLAERAQEREDTEGGGTLTMLPYAIGDGGDHTLYVNNQDATSSLFPLDRALNANFEHLHTLRTVRAIPVVTRRLDDVIEDDFVDFLKLDIQGGELLALQGGESVLARTGVIHCEVEFTPLYRGQALFPEIQLFLNARGFSLIDLLVPHRYAYVTETGVDARDRLLWGDAVFFRETSDTRTLAVQSLIAGLVYQKPSLAQHLMERIRHAEQPFLRKDRQSAVSNEQ